MHPDVVDLRDFYARPLGGMVRRLLVHRIRARWRRTSGATLMGLGYTTPFLSAFRGDAARLGALMPAEQGALMWPSKGPVHSVLVEEETLPLLDATRRLHARRALPGGKRAGAAAAARDVARAEAGGQPADRGAEPARSMGPHGTTPFGHGRPYSSAQLERLLADALFTPVEWGAALYLPPIDRPLVLRSAMALERMGARLWPAFAGLIIVEAKKELVAPIGKGRRARVLEDLVPAAGRPAHFSDRPSQRTAKKLDPP